MSWLDNGVIKVGVDRTLGGAITWLSPSKPPRTLLGSRKLRNVVNNFDYGRQIQMSFYSGPVPFKFEDQSPAEQWNHLGWNPVQVGDDFENRSKVVALKNDGKEIYVKCIPMHWPLNNVPANCTFESWIRLQRNAVVVKAKLTNLRLDKKQYRARLQELPAVYANSSFHRLYCYRGNKPFTNQRVERLDTKAPGKHPWIHWNTTENWSALLNTQGWGIGVWSPGTIHHTGGFAGRPARAERVNSKSKSTGYIAPQKRIILDHNIEYTYQYAVILGTLKQIRGFVYSQPRPPLVPNWQFEKSRQGWFYIRATDQGWPIDSRLSIKLEKADPQMLSPVIFWNAKDAPVLRVEARYKKAKGQMKVFFRKLGAEGFLEDHAGVVDVEPTDEFRTYELDLAGNPNYRGSIIQLRIDPIGEGLPGGQIEVRRIGFGPK